MRERIAPQMAAAYGTTFWITLRLVAVAFVVALVLLPRHKPEPVDDQDDPVDADAEAAVLTAA